MGMLKIAYQNVGGRNLNQHMWLEECRQREVDVIFVGEVYTPKEGLGTVNMMGYELVAEIKGGSRVVAYWKQGMGDKGRIIVDEEDAIGIHWKGRKIIGVYGKGKGKGIWYKTWVEKIVGYLKDSEGVLIGDWNAHHPRWSLTGKRDARGGALEEAIMEVGAEIFKTKGPTWERVVKGKQQQSRIDLVFAKGDQIVDRLRKHKLGSDHWGLIMEMKGPHEWAEIEKEVVDWDKVDETVGKGKKEEEKNNELVKFRRNHLKKIKL